MLSMMNCAEGHEAPLKTITTSSPGSVLAQQYRVQYRVGSQSFWQLFATCRRREQAQRCLEQLSHKGYSARMVTYRLAPVSA